ncbi:MAG: histone deacetylase family protein [Hyphomicrobiales bacterium]
MITVFDEVQRLHAPQGYIVAGKLQPSPERPDRIDALMQGVARLGGPIVRPPAIRRERLELVHTPRYLDFLENVWTRWSRLPDAGPYPVPNIHALGRSTLAEVSYPDGVVGQCGYHLGDGSCPITAETWGSALASASSAAHAADLLLGGEKLVYALCRPPGHHAAADVAAGFCYISNSALAAGILNKAGRRVAILDIDVHHGNGTEAVFYERADVLTVSLHAETQRFYPFFWGYATERGRGAGEGFNLNLPLPRGTTLAEYRKALDVAFARIAKFAPDTLVIAAGLDISIDDPFKAFAIETEGFNAIGRAIAALKLPMLVVQEGGYPSPSLGANLAELLGGLGA